MTSNEWNLEKQNGIIKLETVEIHKQWTPKIVGQSEKAYNRFFLAVSEGAKPAKKKFQTSSLQNSNTINFYFLNSLNNEVCPCSNLHKLTHICWRVIEKDNLLFSGHIPDLSLPSQIHQEWLFFFTYASEFLTVT